MTWTTSILRPSNVWVRVVTMVIQGQLYFCVVVKSICFLPLSISAFPATVIRLQFEIGKQNMLLQWLWACYVVFGVLLNLSTAEEVLAVLCMHVQKLDLKTGLRKTLVDFHCLFQINFHLLVKTLK